MALNLSNSVKLPWIGLVLVSIGFGGFVLLGGTKPAYTHYPCSPPAGYYAPVAPVYGPAGVHGQARRVSRRTSRRVSRRR